MARIPCKVGRISPSARSANAWAKAKCWVTQYACLFAHGYCVSVRNIVFTYVCVCVCVCVCVAAVLVSGGVDSSVCAALLRAALPAEQIYALHIDTGFMRKD